MSSTETLQLSVTFPHGAYSGSELGAPEEIPSPARLHEALLAAAAGGPWARPDGRVLVASDEHAAALEWLERTEPLGIVPPRTRLTAPRARRYRWRLSPVDPADTDFEPRSAVDGPVVYVWPAAPADVVDALRTVAREVTHVGRADSIARVEVSESGTPPAGLHPLAARRGPGRTLRIPRRGRTAALVAAHREACVRGSHAVGSTGKQAYDQLVTGANERATALCRFAPPVADARWPYAEVWSLPIDIPPARARTLLAPAVRVPAAVAVHRALVRAIGTDVPPFVTGRDGDGPLRGSGHLAIQLARDDAGDPVVLLGLPHHIADADRAALHAAVARPLRARAPRVDSFTTGRPRIGTALPFWRSGGRLMRTDVPIALDVPGRPRHAPWTVADAVVCSIGYAMRGVLEEMGVEWGSGWQFRRGLVASLRGDYGVEAVARTVPAAASRFVHRAREGDLVVAAHAVVRLGELAPYEGGFLALGRARHLGGGLLVPIEEAR